MRTSNREIHTPIPGDGTSIRAVIRRYRCIIYMTYTGRFVRIAIKVEVVSRSATYHDPVANFKSVNSLRIGLKALVAVFDIDGDVVWRAISQRHLGKSRVACRNTADVAGTLTRVTSHCSGGRAVEAGCTVADVWSSYAIKVVS